MGWRASALEKVEVINSVPEERPGSISSILPPGSSQVSASNNDSRIARKRNPETTRAPLSFPLAPLQVRASLSLLRRLFVFRQTENKGLVGFVSQSSLLIAGQRFRLSA
jgi:hypothetical protein